MLGGRREEIPHGARGIICNRLYGNTYVENFNAENFLFKDWFDDEKKRAVEEELQALIRKEEMISDAVDLLARLNIEEIGKAMEHIKQLRPFS